MDAQRAQPSEIRRGHHLLLPDHHRRLDAQCHALLGRAETAERGFESAWRGFEAEMLEHLAAEEQVVLPAYAEHAPRETQCLLDEHDRIRELMAPICPEIERGRPCVARLRRLVEALAAHAAREDALMYLWAQRQLPQDSRRGLFDRFIHLWFARR